MILSTNCADTSSSLCKCVFYPVMKRKRPGDRNQEEHPTTSSLPQGSGGDVFSILPEVSDSETDDDAMNDRPLTSAYPSFEDFKGAVRRAEVWQSLTFFKCFQDAYDVESLVKALVLVAQMAKNPNHHFPGASSYQKFLFPYGVVKCCAIYYRESVTVEIHLIATLKGVPNSVGKSCEEALVALINLGFRSATIKIVSILSDKWIEYLLQNGWTIDPYNFGTVRMQIATDTVPDVACRE